jgi:hypothetical protein
MNFETIYGDWYAIYDDDVVQYKSSMPQERVAGRRVVAMQSPVQMALNFCDTMSTCAGRAGTGRGIHLTMMK